MTASPFATHEVFNQTPPLGDMNLWRDDPALQGAVRAFGRVDNELLASLSAFGERWGTVEMAEFGRLANENPPKLHTYDPHGYRADRVEIHPAYHALMRESRAAATCARIRRGQSPTATPTASPGTNGSSRRRCPTHF
jgi:putative acyl-CoA dehydrogenase